MKTSDCLVIGGGNIGKLFAACLGSHGAQVVVKEVGPHAEAMREAGIAVKVGSREIRPQVEIVRHYSEMDTTRPRLVVFCTKAYDLESSLRELKESGIPVEATLTPLNGLGIEEKVAESFPGAEIVASSVTFPVETESPNVARIANPRGGIAFAHHAGPRRGQVEALVETVRGVGFESISCDNAANMRWSKLLLNIICNASGAILDMRPDDIYQDGFASLIEQLMLREFFDVARANMIEFVELPAYSLTRLKLIQFASSTYMPLPFFQKAFGARVRKARGDKRGSFDLDLNILGRTRTEAAWYNGAIAAAAERMGISAPCNATLAQVLDRVAADPEAREHYRHHPQRLYWEITADE